MKRNPYDNSKNFYSQKLEKNASFNKSDKSHYKKGKNNYNTSSRKVYI